MSMMFRISQTSLPLCWPISEVQPSIMMEMCMFSPVILTNFVANQVRFWQKRPISPVDQRLWKLSWTLDWFPGVKHTQLGILSIDIYISHQLTCNVIEAWCLITRLFHCVWWTSYTFPDWMNFNNSFPIISHFILNQIAFHN